MILLISAIVLSILDVPHIIVIITIRGSLDQLLHDLIVVSILAVNFRCLDCRVFLTLEQLHVKLIDLARVCPQHFGTVLVHPHHEYCGEELRVLLFEVVLVCFGGLV